MTDWSKRSDAGIIVGNSFCECVVRLHILCKRSGLCVKHQGQMGKQGSGSLLYLRCSLENGRSTGTTDAEPHSLMDGANGSLLYLRCYLYTGRSTEKMGYSSNSRDTLLAALLSRATNISFNTIKRLWTHPYEGAKIDTLLKIARALDVPVTDLIEELPD